jgi:hypothetical protein
MRKAVQLSSLLVLLLGMTLMTEKQAHAYADPGSSLLILQTVGSVLTASALYFRRRIASLFRSNKSSETNAIATETSTSTSAK